MALESKIVDPATSTAANVATGTDAVARLEVALAASQVNAGYAVKLLEQDPGTSPGVLTRVAPIASPDRRQSMGLDTILFDYTFNATTHNTSIWSYTFTTMTMTQAGGALLCNTSLTATATTGSILRTFRTFTLRGAAALRVDMIALITTTPLANQVFEAGIATGTATAAPTDGVYWRLTDAGLIGVINYNNVETPTGVLIAAGSAALTKYAVYRINITERSVEFWRAGFLLATLAVPNGNGSPFITDSLPAVIVQRNAGTVSGSPQMQVKVATLTISALDLQTGRPNAEICDGMGLMGYQGQDGGTMGSTALLTNSLAPGAGAAMTNTTAALGVGLGGQFTATPTLAANTDGIVCSYANPAGGVAQTPRVLRIKGVKIQGVVSAALTGGPVVYEYTLAYGHTAVSLATAETGSFVTATAKAPRRIFLGWEVFAATAAVGVLGSAGVYMAFNEPVYVNPGEFVAVTAKNIGTVTSAGTITFGVVFDVGNE